MMFVNPSHHTATHWVNNRLHLFLALVRKVLWTPMLCVIYLSNCFTRDTIPAILPPPPLVPVRTLIYTQQSLLAIERDLDNPDLELLFIPDALGPVHVLLNHGAHRLRALRLDDQQASVIVVRSRIEKRASNLGEAVCGELLDPFEVLCALGGTTRNRVRVVWCPDGKGFLFAHLLVSLFDV